MINYEITQNEFKKRLEDKDIVCVLADMMAKESFCDLSYKKPSIIALYIDRAEHYIEKLEKYNLKIVYKEGTQNETK